jgi:hypothetical protein
MEIYETSYRNHNINMNITKAYSVNAHNLLNLDMKVDVHIYSYVLGLLCLTPLSTMLTSSAVDRGFEPRSGQTKDFKIGICCFPAKHHAALRRKSNHNNVSAWSDMSTRGLLFQ